MVCLQLFDDIGTAYKATRVECETHTQGMHLGLLDMPGQGGQALTIKHLNCEGIGFWRLSLTFQMP